MLIPEYTYYSVCETILNRTDREIERYITDCLISIEKYRDEIGREKAFSKVEIIRYVRNDIDYSIAGLKAFIDSLEHIGLIHKSNLGKWRFKPSYDKVAKTEFLNIILKENISINDMFLKVKLELI